MVAMGQSKMPPLSLWRWGFETKTHRQICTNTNVCNHFIPSSLCDHVGETFRDRVGRTRQPAARAGTGRTVGVSHAESKSRLSQAVTG